MHSIPRGRCAEVPTGDCSNWLAREGRESFGGVGQKRMDRKRWEQEGGSRKVNESLLSTLPSFSFTASQLLPRPDLWPFVQPPVNLGRAKVEDEIPQTASTSNIKRGSFTLCLL